MGLLIRWSDNGKSTIGRKDCSLQSHEKYDLRRYSNVKIAIAIEMMTTIELLLTFSTFAKLYSKVANNTLCKTTASDDHTDVGQIETSRLHLKLSRAVYDIYDLGISTKLAILGAQNATFESKILRYSSRVCHLKPDPLHTRTSPCTSR